MDVLELLVTHYLSSRSSEAEKHLKLLLSRSKGDAQTRTILRMANYYLENKQPANARACVLKYLQRKPANSGFSWRILGTFFVIKEYVNCNLIAWTLLLNAYARQTFLILIMLKTGCGLLKFML